MSEEMMNEVEATVAYDDYDTFFSSNTSESYRDEQEDLLFVRRAPHQVRPPADTGVDYGRNEADQKYHLSLNNPPKRPEYNWNSVQLENARHICQACRDVFNYYCRYVETRLEVSRSFEILVSRDTKLESMERSQRRIARDLNSQIPSCIISISFLCLHGQTLPNVTYVNYF